MYDDFGEKPKEGLNFRNGEYQNFSKEDVTNWRKELFQDVLREAYEAEQAVADDDAFAEELADIILVTMSVAVHCGIDIGEQVERKRLKNIFRPYKHEEGND